MKSKPPSKKARIEPLLAEPPRNREASASPSSTSSAVSSLLSVGGAIISPSTKALLASVSSEAKGAPSTVGGGSRPGAPTYPAIVVKDLTDSKSFPKFSSIATNLTVKQEEGATTNTENLSLEDIDSLQSELETLWSNIALRLKTLKTEQASIQSLPSSLSSVLEHYDPCHQEKINAVATIIDSGHGTRTSVSAAAKLLNVTQTSAGSPGSVANSPGGPPTPGGTKRAKSEKIGKKRNKAEGSAIAKVLTKKNNEKLARATQNRSHSISSDLGLDGLHKREAPTHFWEFVDSFCQDLSADNLEDLRKITDEHAKIPDGIMDIPPLGPHFKDDPDTVLQKNKEAKANKEKNASGPLAQRIVAALIEDRTTAFTNQGTKRKVSSGGIKDDNVSHCNTDSVLVPRINLIKALGLDNGPKSPASIEMDLKECLKEQSILADDPNDPLLKDTDDEIYEEIIRTQHALRKLNYFNSTQLFELYEQSKAEFEKLELKRELEKADKEVLEAYKTITSSKLKKKAITKKERECVQKALENRNEILRKLSYIKPKAKTNNNAPADTKNTEVT